LSIFYAFKLLCSHLFGYIFVNVVETSPNLAVDAAGDVGKAAPVSATDNADVVGKMAPILATDAADAADEAGNGEETRPQLVTDGPAQVIRDICNHVSYPWATKTASWANSGVTQKNTTQACAKRETTQGSSGVRKKATQGGVSRKGNQSSPRRSARKTAGRKCSHSSSSSSSSADSCVVSE
jgi:hypothetical protein